MLIFISYWILILPFLNALYLSVYDVLNFLLSQVSTVSWRFQPLQNSLVKNCQA